MVPAEQEAPAAPGLMVILTAEQAVMVVTTTLVPVEEAEVVLATPPSD